MVGKTVLSVDGDENGLTITFTDGSTFSVKPETQDSVYAIQEGWGSYSPILTYS